MSNDSVFSPDFVPTLEALKALGRDLLIQLQNEAAQRLINQEKIYGPKYRPGGRQAFMEWSLKKDIELIREALLALDQESGISYEFRVKQDSREDIAERLVVARKKALFYRSDEGVDIGESRVAQQAMEEALKLAKELEARGYPLTDLELSAAKDRIADRAIRMKYGVRRRDLKKICQRCRASIFADSAYCLNCGEWLGGKPEKVVFVSHASEDKESIVDLLVQEMKKTGIRYWYDSAEIKWGDSIIEKISDGLQKSTCVIVVLSKNFLNKFWPKKELHAALFMRKTVLPLIVAASEIEKQEIREKLPLLSDIKYQEWQGSGTPHALISALREL